MNSEFQRRFLEEMSKQTKLLSNVRALVFISSVFITMQLVVIAGVLLAS